MVRHKIGRVAPLGVKRGESFIIEHSKLATIPEQEEDGGKNGMNELKKGRKGPETIENGKEKEGQHKQDSVDVSSSSSSGSVISEEWNDVVKRSVDAKKRAADASSRQRIKQSFVFTNILHICLGVGTLYLCRYFAHRDHERLEHYFYYLRMYHDVITGIITISACIEVFTGFVVLPWTNWGRGLPNHVIKIVNSYDNYLNIVLALNLVASFMTALVGARPIHELLDNVVITEAFHWTHHTKLNKLPPGWSKVHILIDLQQDFQCCGLHSWHDWYFSPGRFIPETCCNGSMLNQCNSALALHNLTWAHGSELPIPRSFSSAHARQVMDEVVPFLWNINCLDVLQMTVTGIRVHWAVMICSITFTQALLFGWSSFLFKYIKLQLQHEQSVAAMKDLRSKLRVWSKYNEQKFMAGGEFGEGTWPQRDFSGSGIPEEQESEDVAGKLLADLRKAKRVDQS